MACVPARAPAVLSSHCCSSLGVGVSYVPLTTLLLSRSAHAARRADAAASSDGGGGGGIGLATCAKHPAARMRPAETRLATTHEARSSSSAPSSASAERSRPKKAALGIGMQSSAFCAGGQCACERSGVCGSAHRVVRRRRVWRRRRRRGRLAVDERARRRRRRWRRARRDGVVAVHKLAADEDEPRRALQDALYRAARERVVVAPGIVCAQTKRAREPRVRVAWQLERGAPMAVMPERTLSLAAN